MYAEAANYENARSLYLKKWRRLKRQGRTFAYVDESGFASSAQRDYGWARIGEKVPGRRSGLRKAPTSLLAALIGKQLVEPMLFEGTCDTETINTWLEERLCPALKKGTVIVMDNVSFHQSQRTKDIIRAADCEILFLPPYSPDFMPIERKFATLKRHRSYNASMKLDEIIKSFG